MQQHKRERKWVRKKSSANANFRLPDSTRQFVRDLLTEIPDARGTFALSYLTDEYLSKLRRDDVVSPADRRKAAVRKWLETEKSNEATNRRLRGMDRGYNIMPRVPFYKFLAFAQRLMSQILGELTDEVMFGSFSGGASTSRRRTKSHPAQKFTGEVDVTAGATPYIDCIYKRSPLWRQYAVFSSIKEVDAAILFTVPKKTDIDRCACKEPDVNMFLQKGVGRHIRTRLLRFGINLNDQSINRSLARKGSLDDSLATLDLSSASDTVTISCVQALLPTDWFLYLNDIRSHNVEVDGRTIRTEMFSSMGNGFTFELESLIFYVLMRTVSYFEGIQGVVSVYGDDIIIPSGMYDAATWVLREFGFSVNLEKSFAAGPFRESCGGHYHSGEDVTPFYLKQDATHLTDVIRVANQLRRWALADPCREHLVPSMYELWTKLAHFVPRDLWGGHDCESDTQLASPTPSLNRLVRKKKDKGLPEIGKYLSWHNTNWKRASAPDDCGTETVETDSKFCRRRRARNGAPPLQEVFYQEYF